MLLIWLLIPAVTAAIDCEKACDLCGTVSDEMGRAYSCSVCKKCLLSSHRRTKNADKEQGKVISEQQKQELKNIEKQEFAQMMKDYGWHPEDFLNGRDLSNETCVEPPKTNCLRISDENLDDIIKLKMDKMKSQTECPTLPQIMCAPVPQIACPPYCLPTTETQRTTTTTEEGTSTEEYDTIERLIKSSTRPTRRTRSTTTKFTPPPTSSSTTDKTIQTTQTCNTPRTNVQTSCIPCVPSCPLPCPPYPALYPPPVQYPPPPISSLQALLSLLASTPTLNEEKTTETPTHKKKKLAYIVNSVESKYDESGDDVQEKNMLTKKLTTETKIPQKKENFAHTIDSVENKYEESEDDLKETIPMQEKTTKTKRQQKKEKLAFIVNPVDKYEKLDDELKNLLIEEETTKTTKDYVYMYVGIPKDAITLRRG